ncbi:hypothetical protein [Pseudaestuariivita atlantica]|uniref:Membrane protein n=1 Tax=Pseudaestuariivita atlantica TaxID=1317121 RepID=A0A0L1JQ17_9RHOB|nr:hypothetical protein [Pseudaestuariivita atlantica]KNG93864.1 membrane protein [Pseudaestuariivita atlantica]
MPNPLAFLMLAIWPIVTVVMFKRLGPERGVIWTLLAAYLILPELPAQYDFPLLPPLTKHTIPSLATFTCALLMFGYRGSILPHSHVGKLLLATFILSPMFTVMNNGEPVVFGEVGLPGLRTMDAVALVLTQAIMILPFLLARSFLNSGKTQRELMVAFMFAGLAYSIPMLIEVRLSPQLNQWIYGFYQHYFNQSVRFGGYRPVVFLYHGLWVAFFCMTALVCAVGLLREDRQRSKLFYFGCVVWLAGVLFLSKSLGSYLFALFLVPCVFFLGRVTQIKVAILLGLIATTYPVLKGFDLVPQQEMLEAAAAIDPDRAASLEFRFTNENTLLERAYEKPVFGWGSWGRNHILDPVNGNILTVTDGRWIIVIGVWGWVGFLAEFGLLLLPLILLWREAVAPREGEISPFIAPLSLLLGINMIDMVPNATITTLTWLLAGALTGYAEVLRAERLKEKRRSWVGLRWRPIL